VLRNISKSKKRWLKSSLLLGLLLSFSAHSEGSEWPVISIIIDDIGYHQSDRQMIDLPGDITFAILPNGPKAKPLADYAYQQGKEVMLHMPMQSTLGLAAEVGVLNIDMQESHVVAGLREAFTKVPHAIGLNNHQGSLLTRHPGHMTWVMKEVQRQGVFFVDSRTSSQSVAEDIAIEQGVPTVRRDVFLDHVIDKNSIKLELNRLIQLAQKKGHAVGIGHPHPETLAVLREFIPLLKSQGVLLVPISKQLERNGRVLLAKKSLTTNGLLAIKHK